MKANAPEKIYLEAIYPDNGVLPVGLHYIPSLTDIEYVRTDAFIEKAYDWLLFHANSYIQYNEIACEECLSDDFLKDFKNYMKGEKV